ncbi:diguanylate cyclase [Sphingomonas sp. 1P06PA]|uniref:sensor domain-containing diguanylate cyclase n=1 Tax=Sphingomonas sp. 1P06PA TaxID=554121 RepID=UPI0039A4C3B6
MRNDRPSRLISAAWLALIYFVVTSIAVGTTRFQGGVAFIWVSTAIIVARLLMLRMRDWPLPLIACGIVGIIATSLFGIGAAGAIPFAMINMGEAALSALLLRRLIGSDAPLTSLRWMAGFVLAIGILAPMTAAFPAAAAVAWLTGKQYWSIWIDFYTGHALGTITFLPIAILIARGDALRWARSAPRSRKIEATLLIVGVSAISVLVFAQSTLPLLFLPMLPIILATFRIGRLGAAISIMLLALIGVVFTALGQGPISLMHMSLGAALQFLQFYLAATVLTVLPVASDLSHRKEIFRRLRESEARYRLLTDNSTDIVLNLDVSGSVRFVSPSIRQVSGHDPDDLVGQSSEVLVAPADQAAAAQTHRKALADPDNTYILEYRAPTAAGSERWFEAHVRGIRDDEGGIVGTVSVVRDISHRKLMEDRLVQAALTDQLTGLANRRAFELELARRIDGAAGGEPAGCLAILDLDHFKRINDRYGHATGDLVLVHFAGVARQLLREGDMIARIGGEEFALILPRSTPAQAHLVCDRLREAVERVEMAGEGGTVHVTISGGIAPFDGDAVPTQVMREADIALYRAKAEGRNRLAMAA